MTETPESTVDTETGVRPNADAPSTESSADSERTPRFRPGFACGLAAGALSLAAIVGISAVGFTFIQLAAFRSSGRETPVVVSPVTAGSRWFSVNPDGSGTLEGWTGGFSGSAGDVDEPPGVVAYTELANVGSVDGVLIQHTVEVYFTKQTAILIGNQPYPRGKAASPAEAIFGDNADGPASSALENHLLTVDFHRVGKYLVADRVTASVNLVNSPLDQ